MCSGDGWIQLSTFCPKAIAGIGVLPATILDRSIPIKLKRRLATEHVEFFSPGQAQATSGPLLDALVEWGQAAVVELRARMTLVPRGLNDRASEVWAPLLAIGDLAGGTWPLEAQGGGQAVSSRR
jgi:Protein of unknown function (DUF3631)